MLENRGLRGISETGLRIGAEGYIWSGFENRELRGISGAGLRTE